MRQAQRETGSSRTIDTPAVPVAARALAQLATDHKEQQMTKQSTETATQIAALDMFARRVTGPVTRYAPSATNALTAALVAYLAGLERDASGLTAWYEIPGADEAAVKANLRKLRAAARQVPTRLIVGKNSSGVMSYACAPLTAAQRAKLQAA